MSSRLRPWILSYLHGTLDASSTSLPEQSGFGALQILQPTPKSCLPYGVSPDEENTSRVTVSDGEVWMCAALHPSLANDFRRKVGTPTPTLLKITPKNMALRVRYPTAFMRISGLETSPQTANDQRRSLGRMLELYISDATIDTTSWKGPREGDPVAVDARALMLRARSGVIFRWLLHGYESPADIHRRTSSSSSGNESEDDEDFEDAASTATRHTLDRVMDATLASLNSETTIDSAFIQTSVHHQNPSLDLFKSLRWTGFIQDAIPPRPKFETTSMQIQQIDQPLLVDIVQPHASQAATSMPAEMTSEPTTAVSPIGADLLKEMEMCIQPDAAPDHLKSLQPVILETSLGTDHSLEHRVGQWDATDMLSGPNEIQPGVPISPLRNEDDSQSTSTPAPPDIDAEDILGPDGSSQMRSCDGAEVQPLERAAEVPTMSTTPAGANLPRISNHSNQTTESSPKTSQRVDADRMSIQASAQSSSPDETKTTPNISTSQASLHNTRPSTQPRSQHIALSFASPDVLADVSRFVSHKVELGNRHVPVHTNSGVSHMGRDSQILETLLQTSPIHPRLELVQVLAEHVPIASTAPQTQIPDDARHLYSISGRFVL